MRPPQTSRHRAHGRGCAGLAVGWDVRVVPPNPVTGADWLVYSVASRLECHVDDVTGRLLLFLFQERSDSKRDRKAWASALGCSPKDVDLAIDALLQRRLLIRPQLEQPAEKTAAYCQETLDYLEYTDSFPFLSGDREIWNYSNLIMREYARVERDADRPKDEGLAETSLASIGELRGLISNSTAGSSKAHPAKALSVLLGAALGITGTISPNWNGAPLALRTSPSGGARHPTEGYLFPISVAGLSQQFYHFNSSRYHLTATGFTDQEYSDLFPVLISRCRFKVAAVIVLTSVFRRNMFRYREARTFRSVHLDAGHIIGTLELVARRLGLRTFVSYSEDDEQVAKCIGINQLREGTMAYVGVGFG